jgi:hypothetical protein
MFIKVKVTNKTQVDRSLTWTIPAKVFIASKKAIELDYSNLPPCRDPYLSQYDTFVAEYKAGKIGLELTTDLPMPDKSAELVKESTVQTVLPIVKKKKKKHIPSMPAVVEQTSIKETTVAGRLDNDRFNKGAIADFEAAVKSLDNNEGKPAEPITVELFKDGTCVDPINRGPMEQQMQVQAIERVSLDDAMDRQHKAKEISFNNLRVPVEAKRRGRPSKEKI